MTRRSEYTANRDMAAGVRSVPRNPIRRRSLRLVTVLKFITAGVVVVLAAYHGVHWYV